MVEPLGLPITDGPVGEERGVTASARVEQSAFSPDIEIGLLLSGEAGVGKVFSRGARTDRDVGFLLACASTEVAVGGGDRDGDFLRPVAAQNGAADCLASLGERDASGLEIGENRGNGRLQSVALDETPIGVGRRGEAGRHSDALSGEIADHFAKRRVLAADAWNVTTPKLLEPDHVRTSCGHLSSRATVTRRYFLSVESSPRTTR